MSPPTRTGASMDADLDLLLTAVYVTADDLLPERPGNARRIVTDAEVVTLCVAQAIMGISSDRRFLAVASKHLRHLFPKIPAQAGYFKRRRRLSDTLEWLMSVFASQSPGFYDDLCSLTAPRSSAPAAARQSSAPSWVTPLTTGGAPATAGSSGVSGCTCLPHPTGHPERSRSLPPNVMSVTSRWNYWPAPAGTAQSR